MINQAKFPFELSHHGNFLEFGVLENLHALSQTCYPEILSIPGS